RNISHDLHKEFASGVDTFTLMVESLIDEQRTISDAQFYLEIDSSINWDKVSGTCKINIFRILQESLQNIHKHAQAAHISISFKIVDDKLVTEITDDGKGYEVDKIKSGIGIKNIQKRAEYLGGYVDIQSVSGKGVEIKLFIPM
ncbi:MAG TPA: ATP-binding protein, partial [Flavobacterium sp.]|nr:ATP-binding protein [Flavobacterium sp.]